MSKLARFLHDMIAGSRLKAEKQSRKDFSHDFQSTTDCKWRKRLAFEEYPDHCCDSCGRIFLLAGLMHGASSGDRSGYGMVVLGMTLFGSPFLLGAGALSFVFRRTIVGEVFGGACMFGAVFFGTLLILN